MREWFTNVLLISLAIALLVHFYLILIYGEVLIREPNSLRLFCEMSVLWGIVAFGVLNLRRLR